jgi:chromate transporter
MGMNPSPPLALTLHLALLASIAFGGIPAVLPDIRQFVVETNGWVTGQEFANYFAIVQVIPGPNMILMMSFIGWKVWGVPGAAASALATFGPPCAMYYTGFRLWDRFRAAPWQRIVRRGLAPVTIGLVIAAGTVMAQTAATGWGAAALTVIAGVLMLSGRINPLWLVAGAAIVGAFGLV